jgi:predicted nicotinamide N-methyase
MSALQQIPHILPRVSETTPRVSAIRRAELLAMLADLGALRVDHVDLPGANAAMRIARPADFDALLDVAANDPEQNLPYWAEIWPSGIALASAITRQPASLRGKRVLELGCGLGVTAIAALRAGADLLVTDYAPEALALCGLNTLDNTGLEPPSLQLNWRASSPKLIASAGGGFPLLLAADVLYESRDVEPLLALVEAITAPGGEFWLAEPGRPPAARFVESLRARGWRGDSERCDGPWPDPEDNERGVVVTVHRFRRPIS